LFTGIPFDDMQGINSGAVALYKKASNIFAYQNQWSASNVTRGANFGYSLDFNGALGVFNNDFVFSRDFPTPDTWGLVRGENTQFQSAACYNQLHVDLEGDYAFRANGQACLEVEEGSVVVMYKDQGGANKWGDIKTVTPISATPYGVFGWKSAAFQDILVANAYKNVNGFSGQQTGDTKGEVYIFGKDVGGLNNWGQIKKLTALNAQVGDYFGFDLAIQNNVLAISSPGFTSNRGAVYIHYQNQGGINNWGLLKRIDTPDGGANDEFGKSIYLLNGTDLVISSPGNGTNAGAVYLFRKDQGGTDNWGFVKKITSPVVKPSGRFGNKVSLSSEGLIVSDADRELYVFLTNEGGIANYGYVNKLLPTDFSVSDAFGSSFTVSGNVVLVGAPTQTNALGSGVGAAYLFYTPPPSPIINSATAVTNSSFSISWSPVSNVTGYKVDVSTVSNFSSFVAGFNGFVTTQTNVALSGLTPNQNYFVRVRSIRTLGGESKISNVITTLTAPAVPTANAATLIESTSFTANWTTVTGATSYQVELLNSDDTPVVGFPKSVTTVGTSITGLPSGRIYKYRVRSSNGSLSAQSNQITVLLKPGAPVALNALNIIAGGFKAVWNATTGATSYELDVATDVGFLNLLPGYNAKPTTLTEETLSNLAIPQTSYWYRVRAVNASGKSTDSNLITLTTPAGIPISFSVPVVASGKIRVTVQGASGTPTVKFHSRGITEANFTEEIAGAPVTLDPLAYEISINTASFDELGLQYYFSATDVANTTPVESAQSYIYNLISLESVPALPFTSKLNGKANTYEMFSVPYVLEDKSIAGSFDELGAPDKTKWRLFRYQGGRYLEYPDNVTNIDLGRGYWFNSIENVVNKIKTGEGEVTRANQSTPFTLTLEQGWNQIGNPYPFNLDWDVVVDANPTRGLNSLWLFEGGNYVKKNVLASWKGAFVFSDQAGQISFPVASKTTSSGRKRSNQLSQNPDDPAWQLPITLSLNALEQTGAIGMHPEASVSKDKYDEITRPRFLDYLEMNSYHAEFFAPHFSDDIVPTTQTYTWEFQVSSNQKSGEAILTWNQQALVGTQSQLALLDVDRQNLVDMKSRNTYQFSWREGNRFRILYSKSGELQPGIDLLGNAYPNPFAGVVTIPVFLKEDQHRVEVTVYDMLGRRIKSIVKQNINAGIHNLDWDGKNEQGSVVESGIYLYQLIGDKGILSLPKRLIKK
jgi:FlgD Ig-like domain/Fibronectin type III domain/FG-GAP repeat